MKDGGTMPWTRTRTRIWTRMCVNPVQPESKVMIVNGRYQVASEAFLGAAGWPSTTWSPGKILDYYHSFDKPRTHQVVD